MAKTLLYRLFGAGKIPDQTLALIEPEGVLLQDEGIRGSVTYLNFRSPTRYSSWRRQWYTASIVMTKTRLRAFRFSTSIIDVSFSDERFRQMQFSSENAGTTLLVAFDASLFQSDWSGMLEYRFQSEKMTELLAMLQKAGC